MDTGLCVYFSRLGGYFGDSSSGLYLAASVFIVALDLMYMHDTEESLDELQLGTTTMLQ
jgi:hypothetical protein